MKLNIGTLVEIVKHGETLLELLRGGNTPQTVGKLRDVISNPAGELSELMSALDGLDSSLRTLKLAGVAT